MFVAARWCFVVHDPMLVSSLASACWVPQNTIAVNCSVLLCMALGAHEKASLFWAHPSSQQPICVKPR